MAIAKNTLMVMITMTKIFKGWRWRKSSRWRWQKIFLRWRWRWQKNFFTVTVTVTKKIFYGDGDGDENFCSRWRWRWKKHDYTFFFTGAGYVSPLVPGYFSKNKITHVSISIFGFEWCKVKTWVTCYLDKIDSIWKCSNLHVLIFILFSKICI